MSFSIVDKPVQSVGYEQKTAFNGAAETVVIPGAVYLLLQAEGTDVRWRDDGGSPTSTVGMVLPAGQDFWYTGDIKHLRVIGVDGDSILNITGYK